MSRKPRICDLIETTERKYNQYLKFCERKTILLSTDVAECVNNFNFNLTPYSREQSITLFEQLMDQVYYKLYEESSKMNLTENFFYACAETNGGQYNLAGSEDNSRRNNIFTSQLSKCLSAYSRLTLSVQNTRTTVVRYATELQYYVEKSVMFSFTANDEY